MKKRIPYLILVAAVIALGLLSRRIAFIPAATGDALYAFMMFFLIRSCFLHQRSRSVALISLALCFAIEFSQAIHTPPLDALRATLPGRLVLGQGFLWTDLPAYVAGVSAGWAIDKLLLKKD